MPCVTGSCLLSRPSESTAPHIDAHSSINRLATFQCLGRPMPPRSGSRPRMFYTSACAGYLAQKRAPHLTCTKFLNFPFASGGVYSRASIHGTGGSCRISHPTATQLPHGASLRSLRARQLLYLPVAESALRACGVATCAEKRRARHTRVPSCQCWSQSPKVSSELATVVDEYDRFQRQ